MMHITTCRDVVIINTEHTTSYSFVAFWLLLPFRERNIFLTVKLNTYNCIYKF